MQASVLFFSENKGSGGLRSPRPSKFGGVDQALSLILDAKGLLGLFVWWHALEGNGQVPRGDEVDVCVIRINNVRQEGVNGFTCLRRKAAVCPVISDVHILLFSFGTL